MHPNGDEGLIEDQIAYYERRAAEYDETMWPQTEPADEVKELPQALERFHPRGSILELACGTGEWTKRLAPYADRILALDSSAEMIARARTKVPDPHVTFEVVDLFDWRPREAYDVVFFSFWLSHVPSSRFEDFWRLVERSLAQNGRIFFMDEGPHHDFEEKYLDDEVVERTLLDGSVHRAVKKYWAPAELEERLRDLGWGVQVTEVGDGRFFWGSGGKRAVR
jgi:trans-aconitate methyltransferase